MTENNIFISEIYNIGCDFLTTKKSFIPTIPRRFHALAYIIDGQIRYIVENRSYTAKSGEVLFIRSGYIDLSQVENCEKVSYITVDFSTVNDDFTLDYRTQLRDSDEVRGLFEKMQTVWTSFKLNRTMKCVEYMYMILNIMQSEFYENNGSSYKLKKIAPAIDYISLHLSDRNLSVEKLAAICNMSSVNLNRLIRELYGMTVIGYIQEKRIETAKSMLSNSMNSINDIAICCGYADIYSFSHAFRRITGCSPSEWRQKY